MIIEKSNIGIVTTVNTFELYNKTINFFPSGIKIFTIDGTKGFYGIKSLMFLLEKFKKFEIDWIIMADEDVVFKNPDNVFDLIQYMDENNFQVCGMRDGGTLNWRNKNPFAINTFFSVLNLREIYKIYDRKEILANQFIDKNEVFEDLINLNHDNYQIDSLFEPYYCFFFWILRNKMRILYLDAVNPDYDETTLLFDHIGRELLYHAWYSRFYNIDNLHTTRINEIIKFGKYSEQPRVPILLKNPCFNFKYFFYKNFRNIKRLFKSNI